MFSKVFLSLFAGSAVGIRTEVEVEKTQDALALLFRALEFQGLMCTYGGLDSEKCVELCAESVAEGTQSATGFHPCWAPVVITLRAQACAASPGDTIWQDVFGQSVNNNSQSCLGFCADAINRTPSDDFAVLTHCFNDVQVYGAWQTYAATNEMAVDNSAAHKAWVNQIVTQ